MSSSDFVDRPPRGASTTTPCHPHARACWPWPAVLLAIPVIALMWVSSYSRDEPRLGGFPFFIWYQFLWVFLTSALTYTAYRIVLVARPHRPMDDLGEGREWAAADSPDDGPAAGSEDDGPGRPGEVRS